ncbi:hypothetical protein AAFF_G00363580 [Aldrovandia affinis]|uniref:Uncharacterized protein n=1 Tax=Aldrovandia affinis TaxID=143900 RepID=A0AAD7WMN6_9TELE|nr:hypothetical protein AAFF_G00363580 [Aldrovandia affinis]
MRLCTISSDCGSLYCGALTSRAGAVYLGTPRSRGPSPSDGHRLRTRMHACTSTAFHTWKPLDAAHVHSQRRDGEMG